MRNPALATYEEFSYLGKCPECNGSLVDLGDCETACSSCGMVVAVGHCTRDNPSPNGNISEPLGSYVVMTAGSNNDGTLGLGSAGRSKLRPNAIGRNASLLKCSALIERISGRLLFPKSVARNAALVAARLLPVRRKIHVTVPAISAYSLLYACRSAGIARIGFKEIIDACSETGHRVGGSQLLRIGIESQIPMPASRVEELVRSAVKKLQSDERVEERLHKAGLDDERAYFARLFAAAKEIAAQPQAMMMGGFSPRTVAAGSVYLAGTRIGPKKVIVQREAAETVGIAEYTVREFCRRFRKQEEEAM